MNTALTPDNLSTHRVQLASWIRANGIDPRQVPLAHPLRVGEGVGEGCGVIRYRAYVRTSDGHLEQDDQDPSGARTEQRSALCTVPLPTLTPNPSASEHGQHAPAPTLRPASDA